MLHCPWLTYKRNCLPYMGCYTVHDWLIRNRNCLPYMGCYTVHNWLILLLFLRFSTGFLNWPDSVEVNFRFYNNSPWVDMSLHFYTLSLLRANQYLRFLLNVACIAENSKQQILIVQSLFVLIRLGRGPSIYPPKACTVTITTLVCFN
jgi:hypothetical protein